VELQTYWMIIWRRVWLVAVVVIVAGLFAGYQYYHLRKTPGALKVFSSNVTLLIGQAGAPNNTTNSTTNNPTDRITVSQTLADSFASGPILGSHEFDADISNQIGQDMTVIQQRFGNNPDLGGWQNAGAIGGALSAARVDNLVTITATWITAPGAWAIANAVGEVSTAKLGTYLAGDSIQPPAVAHVISSASDPATIPGASASKVTLLELLVLVALIIGIALAFLLDYLDDRIRTKDEVAHLLELPIYAEVPRAPTPGRTAVK
jgi:capsular polysaccharide biosynthesis protein